MANLVIKAVVDEFYSNPNVKIEGKGIKTWDSEGISLSLKSDENKYFVMLTSDKKFDWLLHFENDSDSPYTDEEKFTLIQATVDLMDSGDIISTEGGVTPGGISCLKRFEMFGFDIIGTHSGGSVYWASSKLIDYNKWIKWIQTADPSDYIVIDKSQPLTIDNTRPVVKVLRKK